MSNLQMHLDEYTKENLDWVDSAYSLAKKECIGNVEKCRRLETILHNFRSNDNWHTW